MLSTRPPQQGQGQEGEEQHAPLPLQLRQKLRQPSLALLLLAVQLALLAFHPSPATAVGPAVLTLSVDFDATLPSVANYTVNNAKRLFFDGPIGNWETDYHTRTEISTNNYAYQFPVLNLTLNFRAQYNISRIELNWFDTCTSSSFSITPRGASAPSIVQTDANRNSAWSNATVSILAAYGITFMFPLSSANYEPPCAFIDSVNPLIRNSRFRIETILVYGERSFPAVSSTRSSATPTSTPAVSVTPTATNNIPQNQATDSSSNVLFIAIGAAAAGFVVIVLALVVYIVRKKKLARLRATRHDSPASSLELVKRESTVQETKNAYQQPRPETSQYKEPRLSNTVIVSTTQYGEVPPRPPPGTGNVYAHRGAAASGYDSLQQPVGMRSKDGLVYAHLDVHGQTGQYDKPSGPDTAYSTPHYAHPNASSVQYANPNASQYAAVALPSPYSE